MALKIYLTRHGQDEDNAAGILNGHRDKPLSEKGRLQADELARQVKESGIVFDKVYSSPLSRVYKTAEAVTDVLNIEKPIVWDELIERNFGIMTGKRVKDITALCSPDILQADPITYFLKVEGAETFPDMIERAKKVLDKVKTLHPDGSVLLATHGDFGKMIYTAYYNLNWEDILKMFHFGNSELLLLSEDSGPEDTHVFRTNQYNH